MAAGGHQQPRPLASPSWCLWYPCWYFADRSVSDLQYLFSIYVIGLAVSQPLFGLVTDRIGRRPVLLWGFAVFVGASILLIFVDTLGAMIFLRFMQAVGVGVGTVVARGLIRDHLPPDEALKAFALLTAAMGFTPVIAPVVGGYLASLLGMASVFVVLALLGVGLLLLCVKSIPHDGPVDRMRARQRHSRATCHCSARCDSGVTQAPSASCRGWSLP